MTVKWDPKALSAITSSGEVEAALMGAGWQVAHEAARRAPKRTGAGAKSIHPEVIRGPEPEVRVSWDQQHFYLAWAELGSEHQAPEPFLRPAAHQFD